MKGKNIIVGVTGSIATYKICHLVRVLQKKEASVKVVMTEAATEFVRPLTFQALTNAPVYVDMFRPIRKDVVEHIDLALWCDVLLVAPATANTIGKIAMGMADDLLTSVIVALPHLTPVIIAPAMNSNMWRNRITQKNVEIIKSIRIVPQHFKYHLVQPRKGKLACGTVGEGALAKTEDIVKAVERCI